MDTFWAISRNEHKQSEADINERVWGRKTKANEHIRKHAARGRGH